MKCTRMRRGKVGRRWKHQEEEGRGGEEREEGWGRGKGSEVSP